MAPKKKMMDELSVGSRLRKAAYEVLKSSQRAMTVEEIRSAIKRRSPEICDDTVTPCPYCKGGHPKWHHQLNWHITALKVKLLIQSPERGSWKAMSQD